MAEQIIYRSYSCRNNSKFLLWIAYFLISVQYFLSWHIEGIDAPLRYLTAICIIGSFDFGKWDRFKVFLFVFLGIALVLRRLLIVWSLFAIVYQIISLKMPIRQFAKVTLIIVSLQLFLSFEGVLIGFFTDNAIKYDKSDSYTHDLGTGNANHCAQLFFYIVLFGYLICIKQKRALWIVFSTSISIIGYLITGSRTTFGCSLLTIITALLYWRGALRNWMKYFIAILPVIFCVGTFYLAANIVDYKEFNEKFSGRLAYIIKFTTDFTVKDWIIGAPQTLDEPLDSSYMEMIHLGGIIFTSFFCITFLVASIKYFQKNIALIPVIIPILIAGITESIYSRTSDVSIILWIFTLQPLIKTKPILPT